MKIAYYISMRRMIIRSFMGYPILSIFLSVSCLKQIEFPENEYERNRSCNGFVHADSSINIFFISNSDFYSNPNFVQNGISAQIKVNNSEVYELVKCKGSFYSSFKPSFGDSIALLFSYNNLTDYSAKTYVPFPVTNILTFQKDTFYIDESGIKAPIINVSFQNAKTPNQTNYYEIRTNVSTAIDSTGNWKPYYLPYTTPIGENSQKINELEEYSIYKLLFNDSLFKKDKVSFDLIVSSISDGKKLLVDSVKTQVVVRSVSKEYYHFMKSYIKHQANRSNDLFSGPSVPIQLYSNIKNGNGIFAGYSTTTAELVVHHYE
ncbi:MAG: DUF4249 domain-containing protein [Bacteroidia bacterium]